MQAKFDSKSTHLTKFRKIKVINSNQNVVVPGCDRYSGPVPVDFSHSSTGSGPVPVKSKLLIPVPVPVKILIPVASCNTSQL